MQIYVASKKRMASPIAGSASTDNRSVTTKLFDCEWINKFAPFNEPEQWLLCL